MSMTMRAAASFGGAILLWASLGSCLPDDVEVISLVQVSTAKIVKPDTAKDAPGNDTIWDLGLPNVEDTLKQVVQKAEQAAMDTARKLMDPQGKAAMQEGDVAQQDDLLGEDDVEDQTQMGEKHMTTDHAKSKEEEAIVFTAEVVSNDHSGNLTGKFFNFEWQDNMTQMLGVLKKAGVAHTIEVSQCRDGEVIWQGNVSVHHKVVGASKGTAQGRRTKDADVGQWRVHDFVSTTRDSGHYACPQAVNYSLLGNGGCSQDEELSGGRRIGDWVYGESKVAAEERCNKKLKCKGYHWNKWDQSYVLVKYIEDALGADTEKGEQCYSKPRKMSEKEAPSYMFVGNGSCYDDETLYEKHIGDWQYDQTMADAAKACDKMGACRGFHWNVQDGAYVLVSEVGEKRGADTAKGERCYAKPSDLIDYDYEADFIGTVLSDASWRSPGKAGEFFTFDWKSNVTDQMTVSQCRNGIEVWRGKVRMWQGNDGGSAGDAHGRRAKLHAAGQWQTDDTITTLACSEAKYRQAMARAQAMSFDPVKSVGAVVDCDTAAPSTVPTPVPTTSPTPAPTSVPTLAPTVPCTEECADGEGVCTIADDPHIMVFDGVKISLLGKQIAFLQGLVPKCKDVASGEECEDDEDDDEENRDLEEVRRTKNLDEDLEEDEEDVTGGFKAEAHSTLKAMVTSLAGDHGGVDVFLVKSKAVNIQARFLKVKAKKDERELFVQAIAISGSFMGNNTLYVGPFSDKITWNGQRILWKQVSNFTADGVTLRRSKSAHLVEDLHETVGGVDAVFPLGVGLTVNRQENYINVALRMDPLTGGQDGLCGNFNGDGGDDSLEMIEERDPRVPAGESLFQSDIPVPNANAEATAKKAKHTRKHKHAKKHQK